MKLSKETTNRIVSYRMQAAKSMVSGYGALRDYALCLSSAEGFPAKWWEIEARDTGPEASLVHAEKVALFTALHTAVQAKFVADNPNATQAEVAKQKYSNPSTIWARARMYAREYEEGRSNPAEDESSDTGTTQERRSLLLRTTEEAMKLYKAHKKESQFIGEAGKARMLKLVELLEACGIKREAL